MPSMTLEQLRAANDAGGVSVVTLKGQGGAFVVEITTRNGSAAVLAKARSMHEAHRAAAYNQWLATEIQTSIDDPPAGYSA